jgi:hypothetical protein
MKNYWLHKIEVRGTQHISYPLLDYGYLSVGFSDFSEEEFLKKVSKGNEKFFKKQFDETWGGYDKEKKRADNLWRFIAKMRKNDIVIVPTESFSIYKIEEDYAILPSSIPIGNDWKDLKGVKILYDKSSKMLISDGEKDYLDLGFFRKVKPIATEISRFKYEDAALFKRLKCPITNMDILDLKENIDNAIEAFKNNKPIYLKNSSVESFIEKCLNIIRSEMTPEKFEKLEKDILRELKLLQLRHLK